MPDISQKVGLPQDRAAEARALAVEELHAWSPTAKDRKHIAKRAGKILRAKSLAEVHGR